MAFLSATFCRQGKPWPWTATGIYTHVHYIKFTVYRGQKARSASGFFSHRHDGSRLQPQPPQQRWHRHGPRLQPHRPRHRRRRRHRPLRPDRPSPLAPTRWNPPWHSAPATAVVSSSPGRPTSSITPPPASTSTAAKPSACSARAGKPLALAPPSTHPTGSSYQWLPGQGPDKMKPAPCPQWLLDAILLPTGEDQGQLLPPPPMPSPNQTAIMAPPGAPAPSRGPKLTCPIAAPPSAARAVTIPPSASPADSSRVSMRCRFMCHRASIDSVIGWCQPTQLRTS